MSAGWQWGTAVEHADVVQAEKASLEDVHAFGILAVDPPGEVQEQLLEHTLEKSAVTGTGSLLLDLVDAQGGPRVHRRIDISHRPLVGGDLSVRMHVPLAQHQQE